MHCSCLRFGGLVLLVLAAMPPLDAANRFHVESETVRVGDRGVEVAVRGDTDQARHGFSLSIKYDATKLEVVSVTTAGTAAAAAEWSNGRIVAAKGGISWGVVIGLSDVVNKVLPAGDNHVLARITLNVLAAAPTTTAITPEDAIDVPPGAWLNLFSTQGVNTYPEKVAGIITIEPALPTGNRFKLGDCNGDRINLDLSDAIYLLTFLFLGGAAPICDAACNSNSDDKSDLSDAIYLLSHLFSGGPAPREPFPACDQAPVEQCGTDICAG